MPEKRHAVPPRSVFPAGGTGARELLRGDRVDWHQHDADQLVHPACGVLSVLTETMTWVLPSPGRGLYIPAGTRHGHRAHRRTSLRTLLLAPGTRATAGGGPQVMTVSPLLGELLITLAEPALCDARRQRLLAVVADELACGPEPALALPRPADPRLVAAAHILQADPAGADLAALSAAARVSRRTMTRLVSEELGLSVLHWRTQYRLAASLLCLIDGATVSTTAHRCGWRNASSYIAAFRSAFGMTPRAYQQSMRQEGPPRDPRAAGRLPG